MRLPSAEKVISDWGERRFFGAVKSGSPHCYSKPMGGGMDAELEHRLLVERVLVGYTGDIERAITLHVRMALELQSEGLQDLRRWPVAIPRDAWERFLCDVKEATVKFYGAWRTFE